MKKLITGVLLAGALAACGQTTAVEAPADVPGPVVQAEQPPLPAIPTDASAGPSGTDNMTWQFSGDGGSATGTARPRLMYASYGSEGLGINLQCDPGTNNAYALLWRGQQRTSWPFTLHSGTARTQLSGIGEGDSEVFVTAAVALDASALANFRTSGELRLTEAEVALPMNAINDQERQAISSFFQACS